MSKIETQTKQPIKQQESNKSTELVIKKTEAALPTYLSGIEEDADKGTSKDIADNIVPLIYILQALSPQVQRGAEQIPGAKAGDIWFRGTKRVVDGEKGILVQWCHFDKCWIEWQPNRGGFVARHKERPSGSVQVLDPKDERGKRKIWKTSDNKNANDLVESREHVVIVREGLDRPQPYVIPMTGSQHTSARSWMMLANGQVLPGTGKTAALWSSLYRMKIKFIDDGNFQWYGWEIELEETGRDKDDNPTYWVRNMEDYKAGKKLWNDFNTGVLRADVDENLVDNIQKNVTESFNM